MPNTAGRRSAENPERIPRQPHHPFGRLSVRIGVPAGLPPFFRMRGPHCDRPCVCWRGLSPEVNPTAITQFGLPPSHTRGDASDVGNLRTAQAERIARAGLLLLGGIGKADSGPGQERYHRYGKTFYSEN